jgi:hypothetical protein
MGVEISLNDSVDKVVGQSADVIHAGLRITLSSLGTREGIG